MKLIPSVAAVMLALATLPAVQPAIALEDDVAFLKSYVGDWRGRGMATLASTGQNETVACRMSVRDSAATRIAFDGRCSLAGRTIALAGTVAYVEAASRYEAIMSSVAAFQGTAIGQRDGNDIAFSLVDRNAESGEHQVEADLSLRDNAIQIDLVVTNLDTGEITTAQVPFAAQ